MGADDKGHHGLVHRAHGEVIIAPGVGGGVLVLGGQAQAQLGDRHDGLDAVDALDLRGERVDVLLRRRALDADVDGDRIRLSGWNCWYRCG